MRPGTASMATALAALAPKIAATQSCDPDCAKACVPTSSDEDCAGGSGPAYVRGPVRVVGRDIYGLDRDGIGRERG